MSRSTGPISGTRGSISTPEPVACKSVILACKTRECAEREYREVARERREARREVTREIREDYYDRFYRGNGRWWRDGRYWNRDDYLRRYYSRRDNDGADVLKGVLVGAAVVGVIAAIADDKDDD